MFCPVCEDEFRDGFFHCPDCNVDLVAELPKQSEPHHSESLELLRTANVPFLSVVKSLLDSEAIPYSIQGEEALGLLTVLPSSHFGSPASFSVRIFVPGDRYEAALEVLESAGIDG